MSVIINPEVTGFTVIREWTGVTVASEITGFTVKQETMGVDASKLIKGGSEADRYYLFDDGEWILFDNGEPIDVG